MFNLHVISARNLHITAAPPSLPRTSLDFNGYVATAIFDYSTEEIALIRISFGK